jgi:hypothetical protein
VCLQEIVSKTDQPVLRQHPEKFEPQLSFVSAAALAAAFAHSHIFARTRALLDTPFDKSTSHPASLMKSKCATLLFMVAFSCMNTYQRALTTLHRNGVCMAFILSILLPCI